jgi:hypothetical protein
MAATGFKPTLSPAAREALMQCFATRGKNKGMLLSKAPAFGTLANAAWNGAQMATNPFKVSMAAMMLMDAGQRVVFEEVKAYLDARPALAKVLDRDRNALETLGVW